MNIAAVFGDDTRGDGEAQAGSTGLGRKMRQEEAIFIFGRNAVAGVLYADFDRFSVAVGAGGDSYFAESSGFEGLGGVVDQIDDYAAKEATIGANGREIVGERGFEADAIEAARENFDGFVDHG